MLAKSFIDARVRIICGGHTEESTMHAAFYGIFPGAVGALGMYQHKS
jgi:hypothetical protein